jgi:hypothetical protein
VKTSVRFPDKAGKTIMAFTDVETAEVHNAINTDPTGEDLCKLGLLYSTGQCGEVDYIEAHKWFNLAALMGSEPAKHYRSEVAGEMDGEQISAALSAAREWLSTRH